jgi:TPR repeat protein
MVSRLILSALAAFAALAAVPAAADVAPPISELDAACESGVVRSCLAAGLRYRYGREAPRDARAAFRSFAKACAGGLEFACGYAGDMLYSGVGVEKREAEGAALMRRACAAGDGWSCASLARRGLTPDPETSDA